MVELLIALEEDQKTLLLGALQKEKKAADYGQTARVELVDLDRNSRCYNLLLYAIAMDIMSIILD